MMSMTEKMSDAMTSCLARADRAVVGYWSARWVLGRLGCAAEGCDWNSVGSSN